MRSGEYEVLRNGLLAGVKRQRGDILDQETVANIRPPVLEALMAEGWVKPVIGSDQEKVDHLNARVESLSEQNQKAVEAMTALSAKIDGLSAEVAKLTASDTSPGVQKTGESSTGTRRRRGRPAQKKET